MGIKSCVCGCSQNKVSETQNIFGYSIKLERCLLKVAVCKIGKLGSNGPFFYADHTDMVHFGLSGFNSGVLVHQSIKTRMMEVRLV
jgi:hypothetical protein